MKRDEQFIAAMLKRMASGELQLRRQTPSAETKWSYHVGATDPESGRIVVALGSAARGDDFSWGMEIDPAQADFYLASDEEIAAEEGAAAESLKQRHAALVEAVRRVATLIDFGESFAPGEPMYAPEDPREINEAFAALDALLAAEPKETP